MKKGNDMDNNTFEAKMIKTVNANAKTASAKREAKDIKKKKTNKARAVIELICWMMCFVAITYSMYVFCEVGYLPMALAIITPSCIGYAAGVRVGGLIKLI